MLLAMMAGLLASCADSIGESPDTGPTTKPADGKYAVGFNAYARRGTTRAGYAGVLNLGQLEETELNGGGFGVFAYYTDLKKYDQTYIPNFMYNQSVFKNGANWEYSPVMYWPNESGLDAQSDDEDKVTFFAYAPYVHHSSAASGSVADATYGITGFSRNTTAGDPIVKYIASFDPTKSVDLCWGVCADGSWPKFQDAGTQTMTSGLPWLDVEHPQGVDQKMTFTFRHALSQLNVQIDADPDINSHDESAEIATGTKVYVRSISFTGIAMQAALNLNNVEADKPLWLDYSGTTDLPYGQSVTVHDGRRDGREGATGAEATNELPQGLNPAIVQNSVATAGVTHELVNLFNGAAVTTPVYVIPTGEKMTVTIVYDVETANDDLPGYLSDGVNHGSSIENRITRDIAWSNSVTGLESGKQYTLKLHLGLNSVKFDATVSAWDDDAVSGNGWLPSNLAVTTPVTLSLGTSLSMQMSGGSGTPQTLTATTQPSGASVTWSNSDDAVATIAPAGGVSPAPSRRAAQENVGPCSSIVITPVAAGTTIVTATSAYGSAQCVVTVTDESTEAVSITLNKSATTLYATESETLTATTDPTPRTVTWVSSNTAAATVNSSGEVTAVNAGVTYITATSPSGNAASCEVTVLPTVLTLNKTATTIYVDANETLTATTTPDGATVQWTSDMPSVASVTSAGVVTGVAVGTAHITATIPGGGTATCTVTIIPTVASVTTPPSANTLTYTGAAQALVGAGTAQYGTMQYGIGTESTPPGSYSGSIPTGTNAGDYYVWYYAKGNGGFADSAADKVLVTIDKAAGSISYGVTEMTKTVGDANFTNSLTKTGDGTVSYALVNSGSNASINSTTGEVTIVTAAGTATVTATVADGTNYTYSTTTATYTINILATPTPGANVTPDNWSSGGDVDVTPDKNGL